MGSRGSTPFTCCLLVLVSTACTLPLYNNPTPTATLRPKARTQTAAPPVTTPLASPTVVPTTATIPAIVTFTSRPPTTGPVTQPPPTNFCADAQVTALISSLKTALDTSDGALLASLVSPAHGMDARYYRYGRVVNYDRVHAKFLFESTFVVDWGPAPGSGLETQGSFHELFVPALRDVFNKSYSLTCNQIQVGGTTYQASWPYPGINFYSVFYPGTQPNGNLDWHTWLLGMEYVSGKPYLYAIMQFQWEP